MLEPWRIRLLGRLSASQGRRTVDRFRTRKTGALLAYLALFRGQTHAREVILEVFWPESDLDAGRNSLGVALNSLRRQLEPPKGAGSPVGGAVLVADRSHVTLRDDAFSTDVADFEEAQAGARRADADDGAAIGFLLQAENLYRGELLPGYYDDWVLSERRRLEDDRLAGLRRLVVLLARARDFDRALAFARRAVQADPDGEESRHLLDQLSARTEKPTLPVGVSALRPAEGAAPSDPPALRAPPPPAPDNLPQAHTAFFGRETERERVLTLLRGDRPRLVTLTGTGGAGKTRLAVEAGRALRSEFAGGVWFVPLADLVDAARVPFAVRDALRLARSAGDEPTAQIRGFLDSRPGLILLDNAEHLQGRGPLDPTGVAAAVRSLMEAVPYLRCLVTSRQLLGLDDEVEVSLPPLPVPRDLRLAPAALLDFPSVQLFADRSRNRRVDFQVTPRNAEAVAALCGHLEGIPLAIELAAAWSKVLTPDQMLQHLEEQPLDLAGPRPTLPERHRSLRATIAWSCDLLSPDVRRFFVRLGVFRGGWSARAAEAVCEPGDPALTGRTLECLTRLRDASLVLADAVDFGGRQEMRFRMLETVRAFAAGGESDADRVALERLHASHFLEMAEAAAAGLSGPEQRDLLERLEADHDNLRAALQLAADDDTGLRLAGALARFWKVRGHLREADAWFDRVLTGGGGVSPARARALNGAGMIAYDLGDLTRAEGFYRSSREVHAALDHRLGVAGAWHNLGNVAYRRGAYGDARASYETALAVYRSEGDRWGIASSLGSLGNVADAEHNYVSARRFQEESLEISRDLGDDRMSAYTLHNLGNLSLNEGDREQARRQYEASLELKRSLDDRRGIAALLASLGVMAMEEAGFDVAAARFRESLEIARKIEDRLGMVVCLDGLAWHASVTGSPERAARLWAASAAERVRVGAPHTPDERSAYGPGIERARTLAGDWAEGEEMDLGSAVRFALET